MKTLPLSKGLYAIVDDEDYQWLGQWKWCTKYSGAYPYAIRSSRPAVRMHRFIISAPKGLLVDHVNGNTLDNRRANLRLADQFQNMANARLSRANSTGFKGVHWSPPRRKFLAEIISGGTKYRLGGYQTAQEAADAYQAACVKLNGEFARF